MENKKKKKSRKRKQIERMIIKKPGIPLVVAARHKRRITSALRKRISQSITQALFARVSRSSTSQASHKCLCMRIAITHKLAHHNLEISTETSKLHGQLTVCPHHIKHRQCADTQGIEKRRKIDYIAQSCACVYALPSYKIK